MSKLLLFLPLFLFFLALLPSPTSSFTPFSHRLFTQHNERGFEREEREKEREREKGMKDFYSRFHCPIGKWHKRFYGWSDATMRKRGNTLRTFQRAMESCPGYGRPGIRDYVKRYMVYEDPEWVKPEYCEAYGNGRNIDHKCLLTQIKQEGTTNITRNNGCAKNFKCWPQMQISYQGQMVFRPTYKAGSYSMKKIIECTFGDMSMVWPCDHGHFYMDDAMENYLHMHMVRDPMERFTSALIEQLTRWRPGETGPTEIRQLSVTDWFPLYRKNASLQDIATAYLKDTECNINHPWWPHSATAMWHMTEYEYRDSIFDGTGRLADIDYIFKLENLTDQWHTMLEEVGKARGVEYTQKQKNCKMVNWNRHDDKFHLKTFPKEDIWAHIENNPPLQRRVCAIYIADYLCFDYPLPPLCAHMAHPKRGVCPLDPPGY